MSSIRSLLGRRRLGLMFFLALLFLTCTLWSVGQDRDGASGYSTAKDQTVDGEAERDDRGARITSTEAQKRSHRRDLASISDSASIEAELGSDPAPNRAPSHRRLLDLAGFHHTIDNYDACNRRHADAGSSLVLVVLVHSAPRRRDARRLLRETWASEAGRAERAALVFLIGAVDDGELQRLLEDENSQYGDLLQGNFLDTYHNLTYKHAMALRYAVERCPGVPYVLKCDDDVFVNTPRLLEVLERRLEERNRGRIEDGLSEEETTRQHKDGSFDLGLEKDNLIEKSKNRRDEKLSEDNAKDSAEQRTGLTPAVKLVEKPRQGNKGRDLTSTNSTSNEIQTKLTKDDNKSEEKPTDSSIETMMEEIFKKRLGKNDEEEDFIYCVTNENAWVRRSYRSKWRVSTKIYSSTTYPTYCAGAFVLYPSSTVRRLYGESQRGDAGYFWIDDVYFTGTLAERLGVQRRDARARQLKPEQTERMLRQYRVHKKRYSNKKATRAQMNFLLGPWDVSEKDATELWDLVNEDSDD